MKRTNGGEKVMASIVTMVSAFASGDGGGHRDERRAQDTGVIVLQSEHELQALAREVLDLERFYPIVCLTANAGEDEPWLLAVKVRRIVGSGIPIYYLAWDGGAQLLSELLPEGLGVWDGAVRVWRPGVSKDSDPEDHPLVCGDREGRYGPESLRALAHALDECPELTLEQRLVLAERQCSVAWDRVRHLAGELLWIRRERDDAAGRAIMAEDRLQISAGLLRWHAGHGNHEAGPSSARGGLEVELYMSICAAWLDAVAPEERTTHPLRYILSSQFIQTLSEPGAEIPLSRIAYVCAMIACDLTPRLRLKPQPLLAAGPSGPHVERNDDGAKLYRCVLKRSAGGLRMHYWGHLDGTIEFSAIGRNDPST